MISNWKETCAKCMDGEIEPRNCEYYGEPNGCNSPTYGEHPPVGNAAAMREALVLSSRIIGANGIRRNVFLDDIEEAHRAITAALSKPPRNCDVGTPEEQLDRYGVYCQNRCTSCDNRHYCHICGERYRMKCMMEWAQMPYEAQEGAGE